MTGRNNIDIALYGEQFSILKDWLDTDKNVMDIVPVGSGKTFLAAIALPIFATNERYHKGKDIIYSAPTGQMIKTLIWEQLKKTCIEHYGLLDKQDINNSDLTIKFPNGVFIRCKSAEQRENLRGINAGVWVLDEASLYSKDTLAEISNRTRPKVGQQNTQGKMIIISTPKGNGPLYEMFRIAKESDDWIVRHLNYEQMRSGSIKFIEKQRKLLSPLKFAQDYLCSWESVEDQFYYAWNATYIKETEDRGGDLYLGIDFNKRVQNAVVAQVNNPYKQNGTIEIIKAFSIPNSSTERMAQEIRAHFPQRNLLAVIDMSGTQVNRDTTSPFGTTDRTILEKYGITIINNKKANPLIVDTDNSSNSFIARGGLTVPPQETKLIEALTSYHYEDASRKKLVKSMETEFAHIDGLSDALRYLIHHLFKIQHEAQPGLQYMNTGAATGNNPGDQYRKQSPLFPGGPSWEEILAGNNEETAYLSYD